MSSGSRLSRSRCDHPGKMDGGGGKPLHSWHTDDQRATTQPSRRFLIKAGHEDHRELRRSKSARGERSGYSSDASTSYRPRSARSARSSSASELSSWTCPSSARSSSCAYVPKPFLRNERDKEKDLKARTQHAGAERLHGRWGGGGQAAGVASGHGLPKAFVRPEAQEAKMREMYERETALNAKYARGPTAADEKPQKKPDFSKDKISRKAWNAPPGYSGFTPGVRAENVTGMRFHRNTQEGITRVKKYRDGCSDPDRVTRSPRWVQPAPGRRAATIGKSGGHSTGCEIPGYGGFVPRIIAGNLVGVCSARAAKMGWEPARDVPNPPLITSNVADHLVGKSLQA